MNYSTLPEELNSYITEWSGKKGPLIMILHAVQDYYGYVPKDICFVISKRINIPIARIYEVLTFYNYFSLEMPAKYKIAVCLGTACYLKGANLVRETIEEFLHIKEGQITKDKLFGLENVRCLGCCSLAPVMSINGKVFGKLTKEKVLEILQEYTRQG